MMAHSPQSTVSAIRAYLRDATGCPDDAQAIVGPEPGELRRSVASCVSLAWPADGGRTEGLAMYLLCEQPDDLGSVPFARMTDYAFIPAWPWLSSATWRCSASYSRQICASSGALRCSQVLSGALAKG